MEYQFPALYVEAENVESAFEKYRTAFFPTFKAFETALNKRALEKKISVSLKKTKPDSSRAAFDKRNEKANARIEAEGEIAEAEANAEAEGETETFFFYLPDIEFPSAMKEIEKSEIGNLPELDWEEGNALIVTRRRNKEILVFEFDTKVEDSFEIRFGGDIGETEAVEVFVSALAALTIIGQGG